MSRRLRDFVDGSPYTGSRAPTMRSISRGE